ncbi:GRASP55/65 PDZ-like domain-containing protein [Lipomyces tetrasporus]|uniref:GRASP55/65 PDZ-like domain-containing protein n=1 Tax=Lipomyces tetrasporus TaxID=54092 RepID=A0AAD7QXI8_9ASCO|nr:GRASP55/65 PDZ-like domain-containing protein [Lipomyces tetrasporus]KAJ8103199.1 GRASP55/65 PDZ-like domain-containing protein [Lipomyces tetrasporus]
MGNEQSMQQSGSSGLLNSYGFHVLNVADNSLAKEYGFETYFDFICGINGHQIEDGNADLFAKEIRNCAGRSVKFAVFSAKGQKLREILMSLPSLSDGSTLQLGLSLQWAPLALTDIVFHVLDVQPESPVYNAGLQADSDYIIGIEGHKLLSEHALGEVLEENVGKELTLQVYNHDYNTVRLTTIVPNRSWGGEGLLGCGIGFGFLHRLPEWNSRIPIPGETIFSAEDDDVYEKPEVQDTDAAAVPLTQTELLFKQMHIGDKEEPESAIEPKETTPPPPTALSPTSPGGGMSSMLPAYMRRKHHYALGNQTSISGQNRELDAYFDEQERISKEIDYHSQPSKAINIPPPPPKDSEIRRKSGTEGDDMKVEENEVSEAGKEKESDDDID